MTNSSFLRQSNSYSPIAIGGSDNAFNLSERNDDIAIMGLSETSDRNFRIDDDDDDLDDDDLEGKPPSFSPSSTSFAMTTPMVPPGFICPMTLQLLREPVNDGCGHCFERDAIVTWLEYHEMCPISRKPLHASHLLPNAALCSRIRRWQESHPSCASGGMRAEASSSSVANTTPTSECSFVMENLLLPQEFRVLEIIKARERDQRSKREIHNCVWALVVTTAIFLFVVTILAMKFWNMDLQGPI
jgi:U-box domain